MTAENFERALALTLSFEGGYSDHPLDPGGPTNLGITQATLAQFRGKPASRSEVMALSRAEAAAIYKAYYWDAIGGDRQPAGLDLVLFDFAVNSGPARALSSLRTVARTTAPNLADADIPAIIRAISARRLGFLRRLRIFPTFGRGWTRRVKAIETAALALAGAPAAAPSTDGKESSMEPSKSILESRTVWANLVGLGALALGWFGFDLSGLDQDKLASSLCEAAAALSFILSSLFRVLATKRIG